jgi:hypothetical protein
MTTFGWLHRTGNINVSFNLERDVGSYITNNIKMAVATPIIMTRVPWVVSINL